MSNAAVKAKATKAQAILEPRNEERPSLGRQIRYGIYSTALTVYSLVRKAAPIFIFAFAWAALGLPAGWNIAIVAIATMGAGLELIDPQRF